LIELYQIQAAHPPIQRVAEATDGLPKSDAHLTTHASLHKNKTRQRNHIEAEIIANMERWRWLPQDLGETHIEVNIPDFELALVRNGVIAHRTRVVVGKEITPTPIFSDEMEYIIVNPYWNVPQSIIHKEMMPNGGPGEGFKISYSHGQMVVRQPPGPTNALGNMKFVFPNDYAVYMHDTQSRHLFAQSHRAFSHGCMRVQNPFALAAAILGDSWPTRKLEKLIGATERYINLEKPLPVHIEYFTTYVDNSGKIVQRPDLYGYSARVRRALGLES
ncbi:MAG: L,D-transpeptidase family protein, partial [Methylocystis sp.]